MRIFTISPQDVIPKWVRCGRSHRYDPGMAKGPVPTDGFKGKIQLSGGLDFFSALRNPVPTEPDSDINGDCPSSVSDILR